jgi:hypothetical protein
MDTLADPPLANLTAVTATVETILWNVSNYTPINANDARPGKIYKMTAGGIVTFATTGLISVTPRIGLTVGAGITMGVTPNPVNVPGTIETNVPWTMEFNMVCRTIGAPGANSTFIGTGWMNIAGLATAGQAISIGFGGTVATADASIATGICIGWTLTVAGSITPQYAFIQSMN